MPMRSGALGRVQALALELVGDRQHVAGRDHDDVGPEIGDQLHLALGLAAAERHHRQAQLLGAVVRAQPAGEQAVAVAHMHHVAGPRATGADAARHAVRPGVDVVLGVAHHGGLARGAAGGMDAHALLARDGEHAERVAVAQVLLGGEREFRQVGQASAIVRVHTGCVELGAVDGGIRVRVGQRGLQALELQRAQFVDAGFFNRVECKGVHGAAPSSKTWPGICALLPRNIATTSPRWLVTFMS